MRLHCNLFSFPFLSFHVYAFPPFCINQGSELTVTELLRKWTLEHSNQWSRDHWSEIERMIQAQMLENSPRIITVKTRCIWSVSALWGRAKGCRSPPPRKPPVPQLTQESQVQQAFLASPSSSPFSFCPSGLSPSVRLSGLPLYFLMLWILSKSLYEEEEGFRLEREFGTQR